MQPAITLGTLHAAELQLAAVHHLRWHPGTIDVTPQGVEWDGWALTLWEDPGQLRILVNGIDADSVEWAPSPDLPPFFPDVPNAAMARFRARYALRAGTTLFPEGFARFNVTSQHGEHAQSYGTAWHIADPRREPSLPSAAQIARVIGSPDAFAFCLGGATTVQRFDAYLRHRFDRPLASFGAILDWGCGAGRLTRYLTGRGPAVTGVDIDTDNIIASKRSCPGAEFKVTGLEPPMDLPDASFDLAIGISVLTHLDEPRQHAWLAEIQRVLRPGALALLSVQGFAQASLARDPQGRLDAHRHGFYVAGRNPQLDDAGIPIGYYVDVRHSADYIYATWGRYFDVLEIVPAIAGSQDAVVLRKRA